MLTYEFYHDQDLGYCYHTRHGYSHRIVGPAVIWEEVGYAWYQYGANHRAIGPARILIGGATYSHRGRSYVPEV